MSGKKSKKSEPSVKVELYDPANLPGRLKRIGGSMSDEWNNVIANQTVNAMWLKNSDAEQITRDRHATVYALIGIAPKGELEGMIAAQLVACHNASMECYRRAMIGEQTFEGRHEALNQANKLSRTYSTLLETLDRHRGKGQQTVRVEHVTVQAGGQAIVGHVETSGGGNYSKSEGQPHAIAYAPGIEMPSTHAERGLVPVASDAERTMPHARGRVAGGA